MSLFERFDSMVDVYERSEFVTSLTATQQHQLATEMIGDRPFITLKTRFGPKHLKLPTSAIVHVLRRHFCADDDDAQALFVIKWGLVFTHMQATVASTFINK